MAEPLYMRIARRLRSGILSGEYKPRDMLPSEHELAVSYQTSRVTVRKSLDVLESEGLVRPWHGKGYFVLPPKYTTFTLHFDERLAEGRFQEVNMLRPPKDVAEILQLKKGQMAIVTRRVFEREGRAVSYDEKFIPYERGVPSIEFELHFSEFPHMFEKRFAPMSLRTEMTIGLEQAPGYVCAALGLRENTPLMVVSRLIRTSDERPTGTAAGTPEGKPTGTPDGTPTGTPEGKPTGTPEGTPTGVPVGTPTGTPEGTPTGKPVGYGKQYMTEAFGKLSAKSGYESAAIL